MATEFQTLKILQGATPIALQDSELAKIEGGAYCHVRGASAGGAPGGVALCSEIGNVIHFSVYSNLPVTGANFLQVTF